MDRFWFIPILFVFLGAADCSHGPGVKVWEFQAEEAAKPLKGLYRGDEVKTFGDTDIRYCVNANDMEFILNKLKQCQDIPLSNKTILDLLLGRSSE